MAYGDGHFITFDGEWYSFDGSCEYTLAQDHCGGNSSTNGTFRIVTENVPCGTTGVTCSKAIKLFLEVRGVWNIFPQSVVTSSTLSHLQRQGTWPPAVSCLGAAGTSGTAQGLKTREVSLGSEARTPTSRCPRPSLLQEAAGRVLPVPLTSGGCRRPLPGLRHHGAPLCACPFPALSATPDTGLGPP